MRYVIFGAGAIGGGIGGRLVQHRDRHRHDVVLIARGEHLRAMQRNGLRVRAPGEDFRVAVDAVGSPGEVDWRGDEVVLLTMKTQDTLAALEDLRASAGTDVPVVCAQNGVENERFVARRFARPYAMLVQMPAMFLEPGEVILNATGVSGVLHAGCYPSGTDATIEEVCAGLTASGFASEPTPEVMRLKHSKLFVNLGNAVQAVCGMEADSRDLHRALREETVRVYEAAGIEWSTEEFQERTRDLRRGEVFPGGQRGSTWQSLARGSTSIETDYLNGEVILQGRLHSVPTPVNRALQDIAARVLREGSGPGTVTPEDVLAQARALGYEG